MSHGTRFDIYLPAVEAEAASEAGSQEAGRPQRGTETILLAEDDSSVRALVRDELRKLGYTVVEAKNGIEACLLASQQVGSIHLLLTDMVMPGMGGRELAQNLSVIKPDLRILFMSGYTDDVGILAGHEDGTTTFLQKPFTPEVLPRRVGSGRKVRGRRLPDDGLLAKDRPTISTMLDRLFAHMRFARKAEGLNASTRVYRHALTLALWFVVAIQPSQASSEQAEPVAWDPIADGLAASYWTPPPSCHDVPPMIGFEIDPKRYRFSVHYFKQSGLPDPPDILEWQAKTGHDVVFNAGLFRENFAYLGLLYASGRALGGKQHTSWLGLFLAEPLAPGAPPARIMDLAQESFDEQHPPFREAAQSLMLFDHQGIIRVRKTGKQAHQTIVAESSNGLILLFKTTRPATLYDLGQCLHESLPGLRRAMAMDGGSSSDVTLAQSLFRPGSTEGTRQRWEGFLRDPMAPHIGLPAVIGISPRTEKPTVSPKP
jgi:CheY-like chemotaxis protein